MLHLSKLFDWHNPFVQSVCGTSHKESETYQHEQVVQLLVKEFYMYGLMRASLSYINNILSPLRH
jgi:hypothetical protein